MNAVETTQKRATILWLCFWMVVAALGSWGIHQFRTNYLTALASVAEGHVARATWTNENQQALVEQKYRAARIGTAKRHDQKLIDTFGGPVAAAFKRPQFDLSEALRQGAIASAPSDCRVAVQVDRFTEFTATFDAARQLKTNEMIQTARALLPYAKDYLDSLRFASNGVVIAELDREDIRFVDDWKTAPDTTITMLLPREIPTRVAQDPSAIERIRDEQRITEAMATDATLRDRTQEADKAFRLHVQDSVNELRLAIETARKAVDLQSVRNISQLDQRGKEIAAAKQHAAKAQEFWSAPAKVWDQSLAAQNITGDAHDVLAKSFSGMFRNNPAKTAKVFEALNGEIESCHHFISMLLEHPDDWTFNSDGIALKTDALARRLDEARSQIRDDVQATESALRDWNDAVAP